jgi:hypothetical protein
MDSRLELQLLSRFVDEALEMRRQLEMQARLEQDLCCARKSKPFAAGTEAGPVRRSSCRPAPTRRGFL